MSKNQNESDMSSQENSYQVSGSDSDTQSKIPVLTTILVFLFWFFNIESADDDSVEMFFGISLFLSFAICLYFTFIYLVQNQNKFAKSYFLSLMPSASIAIACIMISNPLSWGGLDGVMLFFSMAVTIAPCLYFYFVKGERIGSLYAIPSVLGLYFTLMLITWAM
jgi:drug/metabolite transporter (DMT)-like permease